MFNQPQGCDAYIQTEYSKGLFKHFTELMDENCLSFQV